MRMPAPEGYKKLAPGVLCRCPRLYKEYGDAYCCQGEWGPPVEPAPAMTLEKALHILARTHTRDDDLTGFVVEWAPSPSVFWEHSQADYFEAWKTVRAHIHFQTEPKKE
jgi:hypothetical protein